jgi:hypothetical protein
VADWDWNKRRRDGGIGHALTMADTQTSSEFKEARCSRNKETSAAFSQQPAGKRKVGEV